MLERTCGRETCPICKRLARLARLTSGWSWRGRMAMKKRQKCDPLARKSAKIAYPSAENATTQAAALINKRFAKLARLASGWSWRGRMAMKKRQKCKPLRRKSISKTQKRLPFKKTPKTFTLDRKIKPLGLLFRLHRSVRTTRTMPSNPR